MEKYQKYVALLTHMTIQLATISFVYIYLSEQIKKKPNKSVIFIINIKTT